MRSSLVKDFSIYKDTKRNEKCPCGSGKIFKKCCMKAYREAKREGRDDSSIKFSTFSPLLPLTSDEARTFMKLYDELLLFSYTYRTNSKEIVLDEDGLNQFFNEERNYFYEQREEVLASYIEQKVLNDEESEVIEAIKEAKFGVFYLVEYGEKNAIVVDEKTNIYNVQMLTTPFTEIFPSKPIVILTALIPYKNRYILDGRFAVIEDKIPKSEIEVIKNLPKRTFEINYQKEPNYIIFPTSINLTLFCDALHFEEMEDIVLHQIPDEFTQKMVDIFKDTPFEKISFVSSFVRSMDYLSEVNGVEEKELRLVNGLSISNYELNGDTSVIPYDVLELYYKQKKLHQSISESVYQTVQRAKEYVASGEKNKYQASSFYSMLGVFYIQEQNINEFEFLEYINTKETREVFTKEIEKLFDDINSTVEFEITPIFLDFAIDLDNIIDEIDTFRDYMGSLMRLGHPKQLQHYSLYKDKKPKRFGLF